MLIKKKHVCPFLQYACVDAPAISMQEVSRHKFPPTKIEAGGTNQVFALFVNILSS